MHLIGAGNVALDIYLTISEHFICGVRAVNSDNIDSLNSYYNILWRFHCVIQHRKSASVSKWVCVRDVRVQTRTPIRNQIKQ